jgi:hypothetical protein
MTRSEKLEHLLDTLEFSDDPADIKKASEEILTIIKNTLLSNNSLKIRVDSDVKMTKI